MTPSLPERQDTTKFLTDIHRLRGVAILMVVATHCLYFFDWAEHRWLEEALDDLLDDSTVIFMFIAGYLFLHGRESFSYRRYLMSKLKSVVLPYLLLSIPAIAYELTRGGHAFARPELQALSIPMKVLYLYVYPGAHLNYTMWFIPVMVVYYVASPLLMWVSRQPVRYAVLCLLLPLSILMHRPTYSHDHNLALALYLLSAYLLGMWCRQYRSATLALFDRYFSVVLAAFLVEFVVHLVFSSHHGKYVSNTLFDFGHDGLVDWIYVQKMLLLPVMCGVAWRYRHARLAVLDYLGDVSFTIFFLHLYVIFVASWLVHWHLSEVSLAPYLALFVAAVLGPCLVATSARALWPAWSRSLVGS